jgi:putative flippase GtrA
MSSPVHQLRRQFSAFALVGVVAAIAHYGTLAILVETGLVLPVRAALAGYVVGALTSYALNHRYAFQSDRPHVEAGWRFAVVAGIGFVLTGFFMDVFHNRWDLHYLLSQGMTTGIVLFWSFLAHRLWTFRPQG